MSASSSAESIWSSFRLAIAHSDCGQALRAAAELTPSNTSSVPRSAKLRITLS